MTKKLKAIFCMLGTFVALNSWACTNFIITKGASKDGCRIIAIILLLAGLQLQGQEYSEFAPVGAEWYYTNTMVDPLQSCNKYKVEKDTLIEGFLCKMIIHSAYSTNLDTFIFKQDGGKIYYYFQNQFNLIYDYDAQISESIVFTFKYHKVEENSVSLIPVRCTVNDIQQLEINGKQYKQFFTTIDTVFDDAWFYVSSYNGYNYIEQIGHLHVFMEELMSVIDAADYTRELRCYIDDMLHYTTPWWQYYGNLPCNYLGTGLNEVNPMAYVSIFPNPAQNELQLVCPEFQNPVSCEILSSMGQSLIKFNIDNQYKTVDISQLSSGIYFLKYQMDNKYIINKIIKQ
jgi:hypothetical protein